MPDPRRPANAWWSNATLRWYAWHDEREWPVISQGAEHDGAAGFVIALGHAAPSRDGSSGQAREVGSAFCCESGGPDGILARSRSLRHENCVHEPVQPQQLDD